jgi:lysozyme
MTNPKTTLVSLNATDQTSCETFVGTNEGLRLTPYDDKTGLPVKAPQGDLSIGFGCNLADGLTRDQATLLMQNALVDCEIELKQAFNFYTTLTPYRKIAMLDLCYNLGIGSLKSFSTFISLMEQGDFEGASSDLLSTELYTQEPVRTNRVIYLIKNNTMVY